MRRFLVALLLSCAALAAAAQSAPAQPAESRELIGTIGSRSALLVLHVEPVPEGAALVSGEYILLGLMQRRFLLGERSPQLGVTTLREGITPILFGRQPTATFQGTWRDGTFKGTRHGPGGQERERFEFSERFASMHDYSERIQCSARTAEFSSDLSMVLEKGKLRPGSLSWTSRHASSGHVCVLGGPQPTQAPHEDGLRFIVDAPQAGRPGCVVTLRDLGDLVRVSAEGCAAHCGSQAYFESLLIDRRGGCELLRPVPR